tara:strand:+ start:111 stop:263 length:153 start_codon:yes stop_codon:yes gene_type:complete
MEETHTQMVQHQLVVAAVVPVLLERMVPAVKVETVVLDHLMFMHMDQHNL